MVCRIETEYGPIGFDSALSLEPNPPITVTAENIETVLKALYAALKWSVYGPCGWMTAGGFACHIRPIAFSMKDGSTGSGGGASFRRAPLWVIFTRGGVVMGRTEALSMRYVPLGDVITLTVPLTATLSKNAQHRMGKGQVFLDEFARADRDAIGWELKSALRGRVFHSQRKVWLDLFVRRADLKSDPINVLDATADAAKGVIQVDDRWFAIARLDWELVRNERPFVRIRLWQEAGSEEAAKD